MSGLRPAVLTQWHRSCATSGSCIRAIAPNAAMMRDLPMPGSPETPLQRRDVVDSKKGIVGLAEADLPPLQFLLNETVTIEVIAGLEREEGGYPHHDWTEDLIADVEVVEAAALVRQDPVIWIF